MGHYLQEPGQLSNGHTTEENDSSSSSNHLLPHEPLSILDGVITSPLREGIPYKEKHAPHEV